MLVEVSESLYTNNVPPRKHVQEVNRSAYSGTRLASFAKHSCNTVLAAASVLISTVEAFQVSFWELV